MKAESDQLIQVQRLCDQVEELRDAPLEDPRWVALTVNLARALLIRARQLEAPQEGKNRKLLASLLASEENQVFSNALTDRIHRTKRPRRIVETFAELLDRSKAAPHFPAFDRAQLEMGRVVGKLVPTLVASGVLSRVKKEADPYLWPAESEPLKEHLEKCREQNLRVNLNYLGEEVLGDFDANERLNTYTELVTRPDIFAVSVKLSGIDNHLDPLNHGQSVARLEDRLSRILLAGLERPGGPPLVYLDMEAYRDLNITADLVDKLLRPGELLSQYPSLQLGLAIQTYLPEALPTVQRLAEASARHVAGGGVPLRIRLVKGANLQVELVEASIRRLACPVLPQKALVDENFKRTLRYALLSARSGHLRVGIGSHNLLDISYAMLLRKHHSVEGCVDFEMLQGMAGGLGRAVHEMTGSLLIYAPAVTKQNMTSAISYLVRRLDENTAKDNFLRDAAQLTPDGQLFLKHQKQFELSFKGSFATLPQSRRNQDRRRPSQEEAFANLEQFENVADTDWTREENRSWLAEHLSAARNQVEVRPIVAGAPPASERQQGHGFDPSDPSYSYPIEFASASEIEHAIASAWTAHSTGALPPLFERVRHLRAVAQCLDAERGRLIAAMVLDAGKRPVEADIEISEAIDFAHYYALAAEREMLGVPRGVIVVTPPWNFPLAIPLGGVLAAYVAGNPVILKPAPETPWVAAILVSLCHKAGISREFLQFLPATDQEASPLIKDKRVAGVVLTGATSTAQKFYEMRDDLYLMAETGGKNAAYVSDMSDRESAISHIVQSAFGHAGQKCSALSVLILHRDVYADPEFKRQLVDATRSLVVGSAWDTESYVTPLIRSPEGPLLRIIEEGDQQGTWLLQPSVDTQNPRLLSPGILYDVAPGSFAHTTEFFGPVLSVMCADNFEHAMTLLNQSDYGLTAGLFSLSESEQETFCQMADAGNLYINRTLTGAVVGRQPFGGRKLSCFGPGAKAGGPDYVAQMTVPAPPQEPSTANDYNRAFAEHFAEVSDGTRVTGEVNLLRYTPAKTAIVLMPGAKPFEVQLAVSARKVAGSQLPIFLCSGPAAKEYAETKELREALESSTILVFSSLEIAEQAARLGARRLRVVGCPDRAFLRCSADENLTVLRDPISPLGRFELRHFFEAQSIAFSVHRHGNAKLQSLSRLRRAVALPE